MFLAGPYKLPDLVRIRCITMGMKIYDHDKLLFSNLVQPGTS
jgi:hypothetical protein